MKTDELLNATKKALGIETDYALAKALGIRGTGKISHWRTGRNRPDVDVCFQIAEILNLEPQAVITAVRLEGSSTPEEKTFWARYAKKYGVAAAITPFMFASTIALTSLAVHQEAQAGNNDRVCIMRNQGKQQGTHPQSED